jgi:exosome complex component CSL4
MLNKQVSVYPLVETATFPKVGDVIVGMVLDVKTKNAILTIFQVGDKKLSGFFKGALHISGVSHGYVDNMFNVCKPGDLVRARVISTENRSVFLSTAEKDLGVLHAYCSICGNVLQPKDRGMGCSNCGHLEHRKISPDYGKELTRKREQNES